ETPAVDAIVQNLECWSAGVLKAKPAYLRFRHPLLHYSITPFPDWWSCCNSSIASRDGAGIGANPFGHPNLDQASSHSGSSPDWFCVSAGPFAVRFRNRLITDSR